MEFNLNVGLSSKQLDVNCKKKREQQEKKNIFFFFLCCHKPPSLLCIVMCITITKKATIAEFLLSAIGSLNML